MGMHLLYELKNQSLDSKHWIEMASRPSVVLLVEEGLGNYHFFLAVFEG